MIPGTWNPNCIYWICRRERVLGALEQIGSTADLLEWEWRA